MTDEFEHMREQGFKHFVGAFGQLNEDGSAPLYHVVGYPLPPDQQDIDALVEELATDETFEMTHLKYGEDYVLMPVDETTFED